MSNEKEQALQRQAKLDELIALGVTPYPSRFGRTSDVSTLVDRYGLLTGEQLEAEQPGVKVPGRILGIRSFGKASFLVISDGLATTVLPATKAAATCPRKIASGKFHGAIATQTPRPSCRRTLRSPVGPGSSTGIRSVRARAA